VFVIYGLIFSLLFFLALYVSSELFSLTNQEFASLQAISSIGPSKAVDIVVLCLSAALLLLSWLNAMIIILVLILIVTLVFMNAIRGLSRSIGLLWRRAIFDPVRSIVRLAYSASAKAEKVAEEDPTVPTPDELREMLKKSGMWRGPPEVATHDTRS
jgi:hypothetical protein